MRTTRRLRLDDTTAPASTSHVVNRIFGASGAGGDAGGKAASGTSATAGALTLSPSGATRATFLCTDLMAANLHQGVAQVVVKPGRDITLARIAHSLYEFRASHRAYKHAGAGATAGTGDDVPPVVVPGQIIATFQSHLDAWQYLQTFGGEVSLILQGGPCSHAAALPEGGSRCPWPVV